MGKLTDISYEYPDRLLVLIGGLGGFILGTAQVDLVGGVAAAVLGMLFTYLVSNLGRVPPGLGPQQ